MSLKSYENFIIDKIPFDRNPEYEVIVRDWSHYYQKQSYFEKVKNIVFPKQKKKLRKDRNEFENTIENVEINFDEWKKLFEYNHAIGVFNEFDISWTLLIDNLNQLQTFINTDISHKKIVVDFHKEGFSRKLNFHLINALSAIYIFYNNVEGLAERNFDNEAQDKVKAIFSKIYDKSLAYRFCFQLRGYVNHRHLPIDVLHSDLSTDEVFLNLNIQKLLNSKYKWNAKVKKELTNVTYIPIKSLVVNLFGAYFEHYEALLNIFKIQIKPFTSVIKTLGLKCDSLQTYTLRVIWDLEEGAESAEELFNRIGPEEFSKIEDKSKFFNLIEVNLNLSTNEVFEGRLGYSLDPDLFPMYYTNLKQKNSN